MGQAVYRGRAWSSKLATLNTQFPSACSRRRRRRRRCDCLRRLGIATVRDCRQANRGDDGKGRLKKSSTVFKYTQAYMSMFRYRWVKAISLEKTELGIYKYSFCLFERLDLSYLKSYNQQFLQEGYPMLQIYETYLKYGQACPVKYKLDLIVPLSVVIFIKIINNLKTLEYFPWKNAKRIFRRLFICPFLPLNLYFLFFLSFFATNQTEMCSIS